MKENYTMQELNLTPAEMKLLFLVLVILLVKSLKRKSYLRLDLEPKNDDEKKTAPEPYQTRYGAYIQSQGRYYN